MGDILIRDVDERVVRQLKSKAEANGTSLQTEARKALTRGSPLSPAERLEVFTELDKSWGDRPPTIVEGSVIVQEVRDENGW